ncbi:MAG TPA: hypothetical protein VFT75_05165 [Nocardioidaceae bacterium]|nr:hypothetical protein [Nocardioidaceae bacterium]
MAGWSELRVDLRRISEETPDALLGYPDPSSDRPETGTFAIHLASWASDIAATLHEKYGETVDLEVGAIRFPGRDFDAGPLRTLPETPADSLGLSVEAITPLSVRSGRSAISRVRVVNHSQEKKVLSTNGQLQSAVVDDAGAVVGRYVGAQNLPFVGFAVEAGSGTEVPVLVGTDSVVPRLGYAVPPGPWHLVVLLDVDGERTASAPVPLTVTP